MSLIVTAYLFERYENSVEGELSKIRSFTVSEKHQQEQLRQEAAALEQENQDLKDRISILGSVESVKQIANEILGLVDKDTVIFETE